MLHAWSAAGADHTVKAAHNVTIERIRRCIIESPKP
jgi:hypothetical protein